MATLCTQDVIHRSVARIISNDEIDSEEEDSLVRIPSGMNMSDGSIQYLGQSICRTMFGHGLTRQAYNVHSKHPGNMYLFHHHAYIGCNPRHCIETLKKIYNVRAIIHVGEGDHPALRCECSKNHMEYWICPQINVMIPSKHTRRVVREAIQISILKATGVYIFGYVPLVENSILLAMTKEELRVAASVYIKHQRQRDEIMQLWMKSEKAKQKVWKTATRSKTERKPSIVNSILPEDWVIALPPEYSIVDSLITTQCIL